MVHSSLSAEAPRHEWLYERALALERRKQMERVRAHELKMAHCTFTPGITKLAAEQPYRQGATGEAPRFEALHEQAQQRQQQAAAKPTTLDVEIATECTFAPRLIGSTLWKEEGETPRGYDAAVSRLRRPSEVLAQQAAEEAAEAARKAAFTSEPRPFALRTDARGDTRARAAPLLYMDVNLGPGKTGRIGLHEGDEPAALAANFARTYTLDGVMRSRLQQLIERYMAEFVPGYERTPPKGGAESTPPTNAAATSAQSTDAAGAGRGVGG